MTAVDTNFLISTHRHDSPHHKAAALATNPTIFKSPTPPEIAILQVEIWMESPTLRLLTESTGASA